jgi:CBS domain-containing protein
MVERTVRQIIEGHEPITAPGAIMVKEAAQLMRQHNIGALLVVEHGKLAGIFTERDALFRVLADGLDPATTALESVMTRKPQTISADCAFPTALQMMHDGRFRHLPVVDGEQLLGMISVRDALGPELEAFVYEMLREEQIQQVLA